MASLVHGLRGVLNPKSTPNVTMEPPESRVDAGASSVFTGPQRLALLVIFALMLVARLPRPWIEGRFLDEEATVFLAYAWHYPWSDALFRPFAGYWNLAANACGVLVAQLERSGILPLERAPYLTMSLGLAAQLLPPLLILTSRAHWLSRRAAVIAALFVIAVSPATEEIYFNVLHIQLQLALCSALILAFEIPSDRRARIGYNLLLFLGPLCGPGAIIVLPLFVLRWLLDRDRERLIQVVALAAGTAIQMLLFFGPSPMRGHLAGPGMIAAAMFVRMIALRFMGPDFANFVANIIDHSQRTGGTLWWWFAAVAAFLFSALIVVAARRRDAAFWLALSSLTIGAVSIGFGMVRVNDADLLGVALGERYNFIPTVLVGLALIALAMRAEVRWRPFYICLCGLMLLSGAFYFSKTIPSMSSGPSWPAEVRAWRKDHRHPLAVWPRPFVADLSDATRPCSPAIAARSRSNDPRYCESGWVASFYRQRSSSHP